MNKPLFPGDFTAEAEIVPPPHSSWMERGNNALWLVGALWLECTIIWLFWYWGSFANLEFRDPDDALRLVQVRNFLAGQSWFDVSQHRVNPPVGGPMHWSRLLDLPIAGIIVSLRPLLGERMAEIVACVAVPPLTLATLCLSTYAALKRFLGVHRTLLVVALLVTSFPILTQMAPLRIDHHAWQIVASVGVLGGVLASDARRGGWLAGASMAMWLHISGEALPYVVIAGAVLALRYLHRPKEEWARLIRFVGVLTLASVGLLLAKDGWPASLETHCDSMGPPYLLPLFGVFPLMWIGHRIAGDGTLVRRLAPLGVATLTGAAIFVRYAPECMAGPFEALDPMVYRFWLLAIPEGQPVWRQDVPTAVIVLVPALIGLGGLVAALVNEKDAGRRMEWLSILGLAFGSFLVSVMVLRAVTVAHLFALPGNMWIIARVYPSIAARKTMISRVTLTVALSVLSPLGSSTIASSVTSLFLDTPEEEPAPHKRISLLDEVDALNALKPSILFAPLDIGPEILLRTRHSIISTGHHRNIVGMAEVVHAFLSPPDQAKPIIMRTPAQYLVLFTDINEVKKAANYAPHGLVAQLVKEKKTPGWLTPVHVPDMGDLKIYRINRESGAYSARNVSATPFMQ